MSDRRPPSGQLTMTIEDVVWTPVDPRNPRGPKMAALWGDPATGPYGALLRVPAGFESPIHAHSYDERVVVIKGASVHWLDGEERAAARVLTAGDYMLMPAGTKHVSAATPAEDCIEFITQDGKFDFR